MTTEMIINSSFETDANVVFESEATVSPEVERTDIPDITVSSDTKGKYLPEKKKNTDPEVLEDPACDSTIYENVFLKGKVKSSKDKLLAKHRYWLSTFDHEFPMPFIPYKIGVYIRFHNQTKYSNEVYLNKHKQRFIDDIALCPRWKLVDFYVDHGSRAPHMEKSPEWCRLLEDCFAGKVNLIVTQLASSVTDDLSELNFISRVLATLNPPVGIYFISDDIFTTAVYYRATMKDSKMLPERWEILPEDELDGPMLVHEDRAVIEYDKPDEEGYELVNERIGEEISTAPEMQIEDGGRDYVRAEV